MLGDATLPSIAGLDLQAIDEVDDVVEAAASTGSNAASGDGDGHMCFAGACTADQDGVTLLGDEAAGGEIIDQRLVDGSALELEVLKILGQRQFGDGELVFDRARLLLVDLGVEQVADNALGFVLALDGGVAARTPGEGLLVIEDAPGLIGKSKKHPVCRSRHCDCAPRTSVSVQSGRKPPSHRRLAKLAQQFNCPTKG